MNARVIIPTTQFSPLSTSCFTGVPSFIAMNWFSIEAVRYDDHDHTVLKRLLGILRYTRNRI